MAGTFPPDYFAPDYFAPDYFGGEADANAMSAAITAAATVTAVLSTASVVQAVRKPPGGDDAFHPGVQPRLVKAKDRKRVTVPAEELEETYNRILGLVPGTPSKAAQKALAKVARVVEADGPELPAAIEVDFAALAQNLRANAELKAALRALEDEDEEDAIVAILLAA